MMFAVWIISLPLCGFLAHSAHGKLVGAAKQVAGMRAIGFPVERIGWLAAAELASVAGLLGGLVWRPFGIAAAAGLVAYFTGALGYLLRAGLTRFTIWLPAAAFLSASLAVVVLGFLPD